MSFDLKTLTNLVSKHGKVGRVSIIETKGSTPREVGTEMFIWNNGQVGTIGGGALEYSISALCRKRLLNTECYPTLLKQPLGPGLGQCCGGSLKLLIEVFNQENLTKVSEIINEHGVYFRKVGSSKTVSFADLPVSTNKLAKFNNSSDSNLLITGDWIIEKYQSTIMPLWVFGAGHVGQALVELALKLPLFELNWVDFADDRFPGHISSKINKIVVPNPETIVPYCPKNGQYIILTHSHDLDLKILDRLLKINPLTIGLIGSQTKWKRFSKRLSEMGHSQMSLAKVTCPIGNPALGKHPWQIAVGVVAELTLIAQANHNG